MSFHPFPDLHLLPAIAAAAHAAAPLGRTTQRAALGVLRSYLDSYGVSMPVLIAMFWMTASALSRVAHPKVFCFFFSKKKCLFA